MTSLLGQQGPGDGGLDLQAVNRDADLLDLLSLRVDVGLDDPVVQLLAAFAAEIDEGLDELLVAADEPLVRAVATTVRPAPRPVRRGHGMRTTTVAIVVGTTLSIGGVAAAVTGDPLAPVKGIVHAVAGPVQHQDKAAAHADKKLADGRVKDARNLVKSGDLPGARTLMDQLRARLGVMDLTQAERHSLEGQLKALENQMAAATRDGGNANGAENGDAQGAQNGVGSGADDPAGDDGDTPTTKASKPAKPDPAHTAQPGGQGTGNQSGDHQSGGGGGPNADDQGGSGGPSADGQAGQQTRGRAAPAPQPRPTQAGQQGGDSQATPEPSGDQAGAAGDSAASAPADPVSGAGGGSGGGTTGATQDDQSAGTSDTSGEG